MHPLKKAIRWMLLVLLILLAASGVGIFGAFLPRNRERYMDNEIKIEFVEGENKDENSLSDIKDRS